MRRSSSSNSPVYRSSPTGVQLLKVWAPLILSISTWGMFKDDFTSLENLLSWRILMWVPDIFAIVFCVLLATVTIVDGQMSYRRLFGWKKLETQEVVSSGVAWPPYIGFIQFRTPRAPWGRVFFILGLTSTSFWYDEDDDELLKHLRKYTKGAVTH